MDSGVNLFNSSTLGDFVVFMLANILFDKLKAEYNG